MYDEDSGFVRVGDLFRTDRGRTTVRFYFPNKIRFLDFKASYFQLSM